MLHVHVHAAALRIALLAALTLAACAEPAPPSPATVTPTERASTPRTASPPAAATPSDTCHSGGIAYCALNPGVTQATIHQTICVTGWTATVRPSESYTSRLKSEQIRAEGLPGSPSDYEEDHRMPLELGGAPSDPANLSPELGASPNPKDSDEDSLRRDVCAGRLTLADAQVQLVSRWLGPYPQYL